MLPSRLEVATKGGAPASQRGCNRAAWLPAPCRALTATGSGKPPLLRKSRRSQNSKALSRLTTKACRSSKSATTDSKCDAA